MTTLDDDLRAMFRERAGDIDSAPSADTLVRLAEPVAASDGEVLDLPSDRGPRGYRPILLAAAAIIVLIAGLVVVVVRASDGHRRPTQPAHPSTTPTPTVTSLKICTTTVPASWRRVLATATSTIAGNVALRVDGATSGGDAVVRYQVASGSTAGDLQIGYVAPGSSTLHHLYTVPKSIPTSSVTVQGDKVLLVRGVGSDDNHQELDLIDVPSGELRTIARTGRAGVGIISRAFLQSGHVYWQEIKADGTNAALRDYDIATATARVATVDPVLAMSQSAAGVRWVGRDGRTVTHGDVLPSVVAAHVTTENFGSFVTDGRAWVWLSGNSVEWWSPSSDRVVRIHGTQQLIAVAGPLVAYIAGAGVVTVLDTRTGASVPLGAGPEIGHNGTFLGAPAAGSARAALSGAGTPSNRLLRVTNTDLPPLSC